MIDLGVDNVYGLVPIVTRYIVQLTWCGCSTGLWEIDK